MKEERVLARCRDFDFGIEDHGLPFLFGHFEFECGVQGIGRVVTTDFLMRFMQVFGRGVEQLRQVNGRPCWVTHREGLIAKLDPLFTKEGKPFDIDEYNKINDENREQDDD